MLEHQNLPSFLTAKEKKTADKLYSFANNNIAPIACEIDSQKKIPNSFQSKIYNKYILFIHILYIFFLQKVSK